MVIPFPELTMPVYLKVPFAKITAAYSIYRYGVFRLVFVIEFYLVDVPSPFDFRCAGSRKFEVKTSKSIIIIPSFTITPASPTKPIRLAMVRFIPNIK